jgi:hypothetical protein
MAVDKVVRTLEASLNREPHGGHYNALHQVAHTVRELCRADWHKAALLECRIVTFLTRLLQQAPGRQVRARTPPPPASARRLPQQNGAHRRRGAQDKRNVALGCESLWLLAFDGRGKAELCEEALLLESLQRTTLDPHPGAAQMVAAPSRRGACACACARSLTARAPRAGAGRAIRDGDHAAADESGNGARLHLPRARQAALGRQPHQGSPLRAPSARAALHGGRARTRARPCLPAPMRACADARRSLRARGTRCGARRRRRA